MTQTQAALKPCPFDNGNAEYGFYPGEGDHCIRCKTCGASMNTRLSKDQLFERWNTRAAPAVVEPVSGAVPGGIDEEMIDAFYAELSEWGWRHNKGLQKAYEVYRHQEVDVVSPEVVKSFYHKDQAELYLKIESNKAAFKAMLAAAPEPEKAQR